MFTVWTMLLFLTACRSEPPPSVSFDDFAAPPHSYYDRTPRDPFSRLKADIASGKIELDRSSEKHFVVSLLRALDVPVSSQMLLFSNTSLQLSLISASNPRALYFNEQTYVGWVPGGKIEIASLDPDLGAIFHIFEIPRGEEPVAIQRSNRCMNCHSGSETGYVPGLVIKSVVPAATGGSLDAFRVDETGHAIPYSDRFGGWYLTGHGTFTNHWANLIGRLSPQGLTRIPVMPGERFAWDRYPVASSDILAHLLHEHQAGFANRVIEATYRTRAALFNLRGKITSSFKKETEQQAMRIVEYLLFKDEPPLPVPIQSDSQFKQDFVRDRLKSLDGASLKDLDLESRLFKNRCSYMIYSPAFSGMPPVLKEAVFRHLKIALTQKDPSFGYIPETEQQRIRKILKETLRDLPSDF